MSSFNPYNNTFNEPHTNRSKPSHQVLYHTRQPQQQPHPTHPSNTSSSNMSAWDPCVYRGYDSAQKLSDNSGVFDNNVWPLFPLNSTEENDPSAAPFHGQQTQRIAQNSLQQNPFSAQYALEGTPNCRSAHFLGSLEASPITAAPDTLAQSSILHPQPLLRIEQEIEAPPAIKLNVCDVCHDFVSSFASYKYLHPLSSPKELPLTVPVASSRSLLTPSTARTRFMASHLL